MTSPQPHLSHPKYRPDIDGLRAVAVLSVVAFHAFPGWFKGGFIGVDVFFVISGYLISTIIIENLDRGTFSFAEFYARRIKRIFPALLIVLAASYAFGWFALLAGENKQLGKHIAAGAAFVSNFALWSEAGYFDEAAETKPLLHLWSLGIEEQFYIFWPLFLWLAWKTKFNLLAMTILLAVASFYLNLVVVKRDVVAAFYSPQTRFWQLLCGSLLAWLTIYKRPAVTDFKAKLDDRLAYLMRLKNLRADGSTVSGLMSVAGLLLLVYGFYRIDEDSLFPGKWAVIPVLGATLVIFAGPGAWANRTILSSRVAVWFGLISFPLYLWHWPLFSFARIVESDAPDGVVRATLVVAAVILAWLTYRFVELPIRKGEHGDRSKVVALVVLMLFAGFGGYGLYLKDGVVPRNEKYLEAEAQFKLPQLGQYRSACLRFVDATSGYCLASRSLQSLEAIDAVFLGDSHSQALSIGLANDENATDFLSLGKGGCLPFVGVERFTDRGPSNCEETRRPIFDLAERSLLRGATLFLVARYALNYEGSGYGDIDTRARADGHIHIQQAGARVDSYEGLYKRVFEDGLRDTLELATRKFDRVVVVHQVPELGFDPKACMPRPLRVNRSDCRLPRERVLARQRGYREAVAEIAKAYPMVAIYDPVDIFCDAEYCYAMREGKVLYRDNNHLSVLGAKTVIEDMRRRGFL